MFLHDAILEGITYCDAVIPAEKLGERVEKLEKVRGTQRGYQIEFDVSRASSPFKWFLGWWGWGGGRKSIFVAENRLFCCVLLMLVVSHVPSVVYRP